MLIALAIIPNSQPIKAATRTITCSTADQIHTAFKNAQPGDTINIKAGTYVGSTSSSGNSNAYFYMNKSGTADNPIIIQAESSSNKPILKGSSTGSGYAFYLVASNVKVKNIKIQNAQKGLMIDKSSKNTIYGCEISNIGHEGIHLRDGSKQVVIDSCKVQNVGQTNAGYGEGIYVGSDKGKWTTYDMACDSNKIKRSTIGPGVTAEHIDVKEGTTGTIIEDNIFNGSGISGANYADSFIDVKGNSVTITGNTFNRQSNSIIVDGIQTHEQVSGWGVGTVISSNTFNLDTATAAYCVNSVKVSATVSNNTRVPSGNMYRGVIVNK